MLSTTPQGLVLHHHICGHAALPFVVLKPPAWLVPKETCLCF